MSILKRLYCLLLLLTFLSASAASPAFAQLPAREYQIKAAFLFNFSQFVDWPPTPNTVPVAPFVIGILGEDPFGSFLDELTAGEQVQGRPVQIHRYASIDEVKAPHILFVHESNKERLSRIIARLEGRSILTVSDDASFIQAGGMVRFMTIKNKIHFQIKAEAAKTANLNVSAKLLRLAEVVETKRVH